MYDATVKYTNEYLRGLPDEDLRKMGKDARQALLDLRTQQAQAFGHTDRPHLFGKVRHDIARFETALKRR